MFVWKDFKDYEIMKDIMAAKSSTVEQGVPSQSHSPAKADMPLLFSLKTPPDKLGAIVIGSLSWSDLDAARNLHEAQHRLALR